MADPAGNFLYRNSGAYRRLIDAMDPDGAKKKKASPRQSPSPSLPSPKPIDPNDPKVFKW